MFYFISAILVVSTIHLLIWLIKKVCKVTWERAAIAVIIGLIGGLILKLF